MADEDVLLVERSQAGDRNAFAALVARHVVWASCIVATRLRSDAVEPVVTEAFHRAWRNLGSLAKVADFAPWFYERLRREIDVYARSHPAQCRQPIPPHKDEWMDPDEQAQAAWLELGRNEREIIALVQDARLTYTFAGEILRLSPHHFERRLLTAREQFAHCLARRKEACDALA